MPNDALMVILMPTQNKLRTYRTHKIIDALLNSLECKQCNDGQRESHDRDGNTDVRDVGEESIHVFVDRLAVFLPQTNIL